MIAVTLGFYGDEFMYDTQYQELEFPPEKPIESRQVLMQGIAKFSYEEFGKIKFNEEREIAVYINEHSDDLDVEHIKELLRDYMVLKIGWMKDKFYNKLDTLSVMLTKIKELPGGLK